MATDPDYRANQRDCQHHWYHQHPQYWRQYRQRRADYRENATGCCNSTGTTNAVPVRLQRWTG
jgi:hypothetical protein